MVARDAAITKTYMESIMTRNETKGPLLRRGGFPLYFVFPVELILIQYLKCFSGVLGSLGK